MPDADPRGSSVAIPSSPPSVDLGKYAGQIRAAQLDTLYRQLPTLLAMDCIFSAGCLIFGLWAAVARRHLIYWMAVFLLVLVLRAIYYLYYRTARSDRSASLRAGLLINLAATALMWSALLGFLFRVTWLIDHHMHIFLFIGGLGIAAMHALSMYLPAFHAFAVPPMLLLSIMSLAKEDGWHVGLGTLGIAYLVALSLFAWKKNRESAESLGLRFQIVELAENLGVQRDAAELANKAKSKFLAAASHDLRQPLHALTLLTSALDHCSQLLEARAIGGSIRAAVGSLEKLFNALLDISQLDAGVLRPEVRDFHLQSVVKRLVDEYAAEATEKKLSLTCSACNVVVRSDPLLLERILRNYVSNAIRYTHGGSVRIACSVTAAGARIEVTDTGIGIAAVQQEKIFDEFYQIGNPERDRTKGLGLGLAIVRRIAELLGHRIGVDSAPGEGARFTVIVPLGDPAKAIAENLSAIDPQHDLAGLRVIVIDDDIAVRESMRTLLTLWGCDAIDVAGEDDAVAAIRAAVPDALLVDYRLRDSRTGLQAIERLQHEIGTAIPVLIISGDTAPEILREVTDSGYTLVHKPVQPAVLRAFLRNALRQRPLMHSYVADQEGFPLARE